MPLVPPYLREFLTSLPVRATAGLGLSLLLLATGCQPRGPAPETTASDSPPATYGPIIEEQSAATASYAGSASCQGCHAEETEK